MSGVMLFLIFLILLLFLVIKFCKKFLRIFLASIIIVLALYCIIICIEISRVNSFKEPIFVRKTNDKSESILNENSYQGLGYKVVIKYFEDDRIESITMYFFKKVIAGAIT